MIKCLNAKLIRLSLLLILTVELLSFLGHFHPLLEQVGFFVILLAALAASIYRLQYGVLIGLAELFIGSQGHLFMFTAGGQEISIRIGLWLVVLAVWAGKTLDSALRKRVPLARRLTHIRQNELAPYFLVLFLFIGWGVVNGLLSGHPFDRIFFDANGWLYFAWIFPLFAVAGERDFFRNTFSIFLAACGWLVLKTFFLLYIFSHNLEYLARELYTWVRDSRVGEITDMQAGFYRIFFQSHIFVLTAFFVLLMGLWSRLGETAKTVKNKTSWFYTLGLALSLAITVLSLSRSNWFGFGLAGLGFLVLAIGLRWQHKWKRLGQTALFGLAGSVAAIAIISAIVLFPFPQPGDGAGAAKALSERTQKIQTEAGASSRWNLLPELWSEVKQAPVLGQGFGETVTYISNDPRVLEQSPDGTYTTTAFEWGWLDIWLKLGFFGLLSYLAVLAIIIFKSFKYFSTTAKPQGVIIIGLALGLVALTSVNFFSPYLNHPLGIGYILFLASLYINASRNGIKKGN
jgi:O-antigen ligase